MPELQPGDEVHPTPTLEQQVAQTTEPENVESNFSWQASEYIFHEKPAGWYLVLFSVAIALEVALFLYQQWLGMAAVAAMTLAVVVYSRKEPRTLQYGLDEHGVSIESKSFPYSQFRSFSVQQDVAWQSVDLEPSKRFMPRLTILCENDDLDKIESILTQHLPRHDREPDFIEKLARRIKF